MDFKALQNKYKPMICKFVRNYPEWCREDLEQEALLALYRAYLSWDSTKSAFSTFAYTCISSACSKYIRDKGSLVKIPARKYEDGMRIECCSLSSEVGDGLELESIFGTESKEEEIDAILTVWNTLKQLADEGIISWRDFSLLYFRYCCQWTTSALASNFGLHPSSVPRTIGSVLQRIRPYFTGRKQFKQVWKRRS